MKKKTLRIILLATVVAVAAAVAASVWTWHAHSIERDKWSARSIYEGLTCIWQADFPSDVDMAELERECCPQPGDYPTSTDFFIHAIKDGFICCNINYSLFALPGVPKCDSTNAADFRPENNAWCVTLDCHPMKQTLEYPFLFSRNLDIGRLDQASAEALRDIPPYGKKGVLALYPSYCFAYRVEFIPADRIATDFNPTGATNAVIRP